MSHFTVMVIGDDVCDQLAPFDESIEVAPYRTQGFEPDVELKGALEWAADPDATTSRLSKYAQVNPDTLPLAEKLSILNDWTGGDLQIEVVDGVETIVQYTTYNPLSKWDWYTIGGRWSDRLILKPEAITDPDQAQVNEARKGEIDFDLMRAEARTKAFESFRDFAERVRGIERPEATLAELQSQLAESDVTAWREVMQAYKAHPWVAAAAGEGMSIFFEDPWVTYHQDAKDPLEATLEDAMNKVTATFAIVRNGLWSSRGDMGWFGAHTDDVNQDDWAKAQWELIESLPDDTLITMVDCHI